MKSDVYVADVSPVASPAYVKEKFLQMPRDAEIRDLMTNMVIEQQSMVIENKERRIEELERLVCKAPVPRNLRPDSEKHFECSICQKNFSTEHHLKEHFRVHTNEKRYVCDCHQAPSTYAPLLISLCYQPMPKPCQFLPTLYQPLHTPYAPLYSPYPPTP